MMRQKERNIISDLFDKISRFLCYYFYLGGPIIVAGLALFFIHYTYSDFIVWLLWHFIMMTGLSVVYHRYFAHRTYQVNRITQFFMAIWGTLCLQRGPLWWTSMHRLHHHQCGTENDPHTPSKGFYYSHFGWTIDPKNAQTQWQYIPEFERYPELRLSEYFYYILVPIISGILFWLGGIGYVLAYHVAITTSINTTACVNSVCHHNNEKNCQAKNVFWVALMGAGEGFHQNHHMYPGSAKFSVKLKQFDLSYGLIWILKSIKLIKNVKYHGLIK